ncbi:N-acetylmuramoyl-L-alanine amidase [Citrobacter braakii]|uniref:N-acetylmuramoyl-L-alanine amidase n=1 Tax=Citrobacter braakii TaxID=57706 RepID=UPI0035245882
MTIKLIVIHCAATKDGQRLATPRQNAAQRIDDWHKNRNFNRLAVNVAKFNPQLKHIGYHYVIDTDGTVETGRRVGETGAHAAGYNTGSVGVCMVGTDRFTPAQWDALRVVINNLRVKFPNARITGHRDLSPDLNGDGIITPNEWTKTCPGFTVSQWLANGEKPAPEDIFSE